jgi:hypothetical protein
VPAVKYLSRRGEAEMAKPPNLFSTEARYVESTGRVMFLQGGSVVFETDLQSQIDQE